jgi:membrane protein DedA with SNARE-associated domain
MLPLRPLLLANPPLSAVINGGRTSVVATGAWIEVNGGPIIGYWAAVTLSIVKFDWVYWWAGKLWGPVILETFTGTSKMSKRRAEIVLKFTHRYETLAVVATYLPLPLPMALIYAAVGASGMRLRKFLIIDILTAAVAQAGYLWLGWSIGEPAVRIVRIYADYSLYVTIGILVVMLATWWWRRSRTSAKA